MKSLRTHAIILRRTNYGEADRILQVLTPFGKKSAIARGVRREKSKLSAGIELFAICDVVIGEGRGELGVLTSAQTVCFYKNIISDYDRMKFGYEVIKLVANATESIDSEEWYELLKETLVGLDSRTINFDLIQTWFYLRYSALLGYELNLTSDMDGAKLSPENKYFYDVSEKGLSRTSGGDITADHIKLMRLIANKPLKVLSQIGGIDDILKECLLVALQHVGI